MPVRLRPREEMLRLGAAGVGDDTLLAVILGGGVSGSNAVDVARSLLLRYGSLTAMAATPVEELMTERGVGKVKALKLRAALEIGRRLHEEAQPDGFRVSCPADIEVLLSPECRELDTEVFWVLLLDRKGRIKGSPVAATRGLLDASLVHPREVFRSAIRMAAASVVLAHNHPSGDPTPSAEDIRITKQVVEAGRIVDIRVLDHVILGRNAGRTVSLREEGVVQFD